MPAKKKGGKKKGGKKGKGKGKIDPGVLLQDELFARSKTEISGLKDQLIQRRHFARKANAMRANADNELDRLTSELETFRDDAREVNGYMTKQYKAMQTTMGEKIEKLEEELEATKSELAHRTQELEDANKERKKIVAEKDATIENMQVRMENLHNLYDTIMQSTLDSLIEKMETEWQTWEGHASKVHARYKGTLLDFGINPNSI